MCENSEKFKDLCENQALYTSFVMVGNHSIYDYTSIMLEEVNFECDVCNKVRPFHNLNKDLYVFRFIGKVNNLNVMAEFKCVSCKSQKKTFSIGVDYVDGSDLAGEKCEYKITKFGEFPQKKLTKNKDLDKFFKTEMQLYRKAIVCLDNGYGIGAFVYFRRLIENSIISLLEMIEKDDGADINMKKAISELKKESPMSNKIDIAKNALPLTLYVQGKNPLGSLYKILSEGVHSFTDEECLIRAKTVQNCLEYLIGGLAENKRRKELFGKNLNLLS
ncbi:hypothetical protein AW863_RS19070 [Acinetobacter baumannii]|uniref:hypothetical protein n=1 Tax=Acinetobacter baumannii TaxID=470 RepID=UPI000B4368B5|nr:hypothetical protein [Acinetobacter baumannii]EHU1449933.1 hypothetical protein [Acinetobacter baumannii]EHU1571751.1 hypothetical protein [Acinetobacter baumannii]EHU1628429.1 hypothetical protein [Acinetobacter baumannii]EHU1652857.1 hypothetical protein [Acinetobacter baumannii]EHU1749003.1 hypothetical protein [Acinetobacter baumannii]